MYKSIYIDKYILIIYLYFINEYNLMSNEFEIWSNFWKYYKSYDDSDYRKILDKLMYNKDNFFVYLYGKHDLMGKSWCPYCAQAEPFIKDAKTIVAKNEKTKETYFISITINQERKYVLMQDNIIKLHKLPLLMYFENGKEKRRISALEMTTQCTVIDFVNKCYQK